MQPLEKSLRHKLEKAIKDARDIAEDAARAALEQLGVGEPTAYPHLTEADRKLRRKLRAHGRQLGNGRNAKGVQALDRLIEEVAYEHWHRMLFARFLAENNLLMYPDPDDPVAVTLEECEDLAADEGASNGWELASRFAAIMLPQIFRPDSPVFQLVLPPEHQQKLELLIADLSQGIFTASDSLGWVYQFWQAKKKDTIDASENKIGGKELPIVTQLFTEPYMVRFLIDNSIGAWWAASKLSEEDCRRSQSEDELRQLVSLEGLSWSYLRFLKTQSTDAWVPAAGLFDSWPKNISELRIIDPCCGSGHFLVEIFRTLVPLRIEIEKLSAREAVDSVLKENIYGLEIDQRCVEIAAFALALSAWKYPNAGGFRPLPSLNIACSGLPLSVPKSEWITFSEGQKNLKIALNQLYDIFRNLQEVGSLLNPEKNVVTEIVEWKQLSEIIKNELNYENNDDKIEMGIVANGLIKSLEFLSYKYHLVITNVPYLTRSKQNDILKEFCAKYYPKSKNDLATVFLERNLEFCSEGGTVCVVIPQDWLFLTTYKKLRKKLLSSDTWQIIGNLGFAAFDIMDWWAFNTSLVIISRGQKTDLPPLFNKTAKNSDLRITGIDASISKSCEIKANLLKTNEIQQTNQLNQINNPDARIIFGETERHDLLSKCSSGLQGIASGDYPRFGRKFWEHSIIDNKSWVFQQSTVEQTQMYGGRQHILNWEEGKGSLANSPSARIQGLDGWGKKGIAVSQMNQLPCTLYTGEQFDNNTATIIVKNAEILPALWCFCSSPKYTKAVRKIDQKLKVTNATLVKVPFDLEYWQKIAQKNYPKGLPRPSSNDSTQWVFHGHPAQSDVPLQVAVARLLGYRWPAELDSEMELSDEARSWVNKSETLQPYADDDGIVCIPPVRGEMKAEERLENLLAAAYGNEWSSNKKAELLAQSDHAGKTLETWLRDKFFTQHCKLFQHRPFIWHMWDGLHDGFAALVNYHKLDAKLLETLVYTYLGDWITRQKQDIGNGVDGAQEKLAAAEALKKKLELILEGEAPYDIFVRWKPIEKQPIGWDPDLNDGVRLNIRPFMTVGDIKKKGAGILRDKPNIKWGKDRGKDVESAPWYSLFKGNRINDHHLTLNEKLDAQRENRK